MNFTQRLTEVRLVRDAYLFASAAHFAVGQKRKFSGEDYIVHPVDVAKIVHGVKNSTDTMVAAALLHDTVEDTQVTTSVIQSYFGAEVADLVEWLTNVTTLEDGNRKTRKKLDRERMWKAPYEAQTIKVADVIANLSDIERQDEKPQGQIHLQLKSEGMVR